jgi:nitroimidazol reductase NimA-like FMN-containing flavoprotein (pyridoxamine 5'-phosphate oxidase superfamily)
MRRNDKAIMEANLMQSIFDEAPVCRLGLCMDNIPYVVPMNFAYKDNSLYLHAALEGKKLDMLRANSLVCFEIDHKLEIVSSHAGCNWTMRYYSIIGWGKASFIEEAEIKAGALNVIMEKYTGRADYSFPEDSLEKVVVIKIRITEMTGKKSGY